MSPSESVFAPVAGSRSLLQSLSPVQAPPATIGMRGWLRFTRDPAQDPGRDPQHSQFGAFAAALPGIILALACLLPFLNKAYTIDDPSFLTVARQILRDPLQPHAVEFCWGAGNVTCSKSEANSSFGPAFSQDLMSYLLAPVIWAGGAEWLAHLIQVLLACIAIVEMVRLILRLGGDEVQAIAAGLFLVAIPPFLPMASTAMPDLLAMTLGLSGIERILAWKDEHRWFQGLLASIALGLAGFARPHCVLLLPLSALCLFDEPSIRKALRQLRREAYLWSPIIAAVCLLIFLNVITKTRQVAPAVQGKHADFGMVPRNIYAYFLYLMFPIPLAAIWLATHWRKIPFLLILPAAPLLSFHFVLHPHGSLASEWPTALVLYSLTGFAHLIYTYCRTRDFSGLLLCLWISIPLPAIIYQHLPIKYMLPVMPAVILILLRTLSPLPKPRAIAIYGVIVAACTAYSGLLLKADDDFAESGRKAAAELIAPHVAAGEKVWFGGQWGFYWYAQQAGAEVTKPDPPYPQPGPKQGQLLAIGLMEGGEVTRYRFHKLELVDSRSYQLPHGRTMGYGAGLYSNAFGDALWVWKPDEANVYELWRIR